MNKKVETEEKYVVVRGDSSGVFAGYLHSKKGREVVLRNARKLFYWSGAAAVEQIAVDGVANPNDCKFTVFIEEMCILDAIQILPCTRKAKENISGVNVWKK